MKATTAYWIVGTVAILLLFGSFFYNPSTDYVSTDELANLFCSNRGWKGSYKSLENNWNYVCYNYTHGFYEETPAIDEELFEKEVME